jgi:SNF family Na+-dependent transporter
LLWSLPLIIAEFAIGKYTLNDPIGAFVKTAGKVLIYAFKKEKLKENNGQE